MVTFAEAQERAEEWVNGDVPAYQHRAVQVREFGLGFVVWAEDREDGPVSDGGRQRMVIARDGGGVTLWPGLPVGEVIRRYEEEYGTSAAAAPAARAERIDLNQTSFLLTPPQWLQDAADRRGATAGRGVTAGSGAAAEPDVPDAVPGPSQASPGFPPPPPQAPVPPVRLPPEVSPAAAAPVAGAPKADPGEVAGGAAPVAGPWADMTTNASSDDVSVPLPATVFAPPLSGSDDEDDAVDLFEDAPTALVRGGRSRLSPEGGAVAPDAARAPEEGDIGHTPTTKSTPSHPRAQAGPPPLPEGPGTVGGYVPTQLAPQLGAAGAAQVSPPTVADPAGPAGPPVPHPPAASAEEDVHDAETMLARPAQQAPRPPAPPTALPPVPPAPPAVPPPAGDGAHLAPTQLAGPRVPAPGAGRPGPPFPPPAAVPPTPVPPAAAPPAPVPPAPVPPTPPASLGYGYPAAPPGVPTVGPGYQAVLRYRAPDGSEAQLIRRSAPGTPHPEWQIFHELRALNVPPDQVLELHTELESCELPGGYCARMIRETWPQVRITSVAPYGRDHASRQQGMRHLLTHQGELHQVADGPARPAPVRAPLPAVPPVPAIPPEGVAQELLGAFGPQGVCRYDQRAVSRQGVPEVVARTLVWAGLPADFGPFFWAQPGRPVIPTLAEVAAQRQVQPSADAASYLVIGSDFGRALCVQYGTAHIMAVSVEAGPGGSTVPPQFVNAGLPEFTRSMAMLGRMWRLRFGLTPEQAGRWTVDFQAQLAALDPAALSSPENWWSVLLEQMWDGLL